MTYVVIEYKKHGDMYTEEFNEPGDAITYANRRMREMSEYDKRGCDELFLLRSANPDEDAPDHLDGDIVRRWI